MANFIDAIRKPVVGGSWQSPGGIASATITLGADRRTQLRDLLQGASEDVIEKSIEEEPVGLGDVVTRWTISTDRVDSYDSKIDQQGWELTDYKRNPIVLWAHDAERLPVGVDVGVHISDAGLIGICRYVHRDLDPFADQVARFVKAGVLNATSVGFEPLEFELSQREASGFFVPTDFRRQRLREYSIVPVPANADCLADRSQFSRDDVEALVARLAPGHTLSQIKADLVGSKITVDLGAKTCRAEVKVEPEIEAEPVAAPNKCEACGREHTAESAAYAAEKNSAAAEALPPEPEAAAPVEGVTAAVEARAERIARMALLIRDQVLAAA